MTLISVAERGLDYLRLCLDIYSENCAFLMLYFLALVFLCIKGSELEKRIFIPCGLVLLLTVYNPVCPVILMHFFDVNSEYYRFFWIAPAIILVPYVAVRLVMMLDAPAKRVGLAVLIAIMIIMSGNFLYGSGYVPSENIYKMPNELIEVSEIIHNDTNKEYPKAFLEYEYNMQMRQYDPKILLTVDREEYLYATSMNYTDEMLQDETHPQYKRQNQPRQNTKSVIYQIFKFLMKQYFRNKKCCHFNRYQHIGRRRYRIGSKADKEHEQPEILWAVSLYI